jgi:heat shock protein HslJ
MRLLLFIPLLLAGCTPTTKPEPAPAKQTSNSLSGSHWRLVAFQSSDDAIGTVRPNKPGNYTLDLSSDGRAFFRLDCNRGNTGWKADPPDGDSGEFVFGPVATTRAMCPQPSMGNRIARDAEHVRSYVRKEGRLYLNLMADGGTYVWEAAPSGD